MEFLSSRLSFEKYLWCSSSMMLVAEVSALLPSMLPLLFWSKELAALGIAGRFVKGDDGERKISKNANKRITYFCHHFNLFYVSQKV